MTTVRLYNLTSMHQLFVLNYLERNIKAPLTTTGTSVSHNTTRMTITQLYNLTSMQYLSVLNYLESNMKALLKATENSLKRKT